MNKILTSAFLAAAAIFSANAEIVDSYARSGQNVTLDLKWTGDNYGDIQWQKSTDDGATWTDIAGATNPTYTFKISSPTLMRAVVTGDPSCPKIMSERRITPVNLNATVVSEMDHSVTLEISDLDLKGAKVVEYGFAASLNEMGRNYTLVPRVKVGTTLPAEVPFEMVCGGLTSNTKYSVRPYFITEDGSIIYGAGKIANTIGGLDWSNEDWVIEKTKVAPAIKINGVTARNLDFLFGKDASSLTSYGAPKASGNSFVCPEVTGLQPGQDYLAVVRATVDGETIEISKPVRTMSDYSSFPVDETVTPVSHKINWDKPADLVKLTDGTMQVEYPRMLRVDDKTLLLAFHGGVTDQWLNTYLCKSTDNGQTWSSPKIIYDASKTFLGSRYYRICNPELTKLQNGWIIMSVVANGRDPESNTTCKVLTSISKDGGDTWSDPQIAGRTRTWEPQIVQLPNGELELLVSSEGWWWDNQRDNLWQEILSCRSTDNGETWTAYERACYLPGARDGMPVNIVMQGNKGLLFSIESVGSGLPPSLVHRSLDGKWDTADWDRKDDADRWLTNLNGGAGAPHMIQLPTGEFLIMAHTNQTGAVWQTCRPQTVLADNTGHNFKFKQLPLPTCKELPAGDGVYYNSFFLFDDDTVWLLITHAVYDGSTRKGSTIECLQGKIVKSGR